MDKICFKEILITELGNGIHGSHSTQHTWNLVLLNVSEPL